jgi:hypothetical protein
MTIASKIMGLTALTILLACSPPGDERQPAAASDPPEATPSDPLPSWNDGDAKQQILEFVAQVTNPASPAFVPAGERIATFDNDGTLWAERPLYFQLLFAVDRGGRSLRSATQMATCRCSSTPPAATGRGS